MLCLANCKRYLFTFSRLLSVRIRTIWCMFTASFSLRLHNRRTEHITELTTWEIMQKEAKVDYIRTAVSNDLIKCTKRKSIYIYLTTEFSTFISQHDKFWSNNSYYRFFINFGNDLFANMSWYHPVFHKNCWIIRCCLWWYHQNITTTFIGQLY